MQSIMEALCDRTHKKQWNFKYAAKNIVSATLHMYIHTHTQTHARPLT